MNPRYQPISIEGVPGAVGFEIQPDRLVFFDAQGAVVAQFPYEEIVNGSRWCEELSKWGLPEKRDQTFAQNQNVIGDRDLFTDRTLRFWTSPDLVVIRMPDDLNMWGAATYGDLQKVGYTTLDMG